MYDDLLDANAKTKDAGRVTMKHFIQKNRNSFNKEHKGRTRKELCEMFNEHFNLNLGTKSNHGLYKNNGLNSGIDTRFTKGQDSWNKGAKEFVPVEYRRNFKKVRNRIITNLLVVKE